MVNYYRDLDLNIVNVFEIGTFFLVMLSSFQSPVKKLRLWIVDFRAHFIRLFSFSYFTSYHFVNRCGEFNN